MNIKQGQDFQPIHIILANREEAAAFWDMARSVGTTLRPTAEALELSRTISDWFSNEAHL